MDILKEKRKGIYTIIDNQFVFIDQLGQIKSTGPEFKSPSFFYYQQKGQRMARRNGKEFLNIKEVIDYVVNELSNKKLNFFFNIFGSYKNSINHEHYNFDKLPILTFTNKKEGITISTPIHDLLEKNNTVDLKNSQLTREEYEKLSENVIIPSKWVHIEKNEEIESFIEILKEKYNIHQIVFNKTYSERIRTHVLNKLLDTFYPLLIKEVDIYKLPSVSIFVDNPKAIAVYYSTENAIKVRENLMDGFYHEFGHHIEYYSRKEGFAEARKTYKELGNHLKKSYTLKNFIKANKYTESYRTYYMRYDEIFVRFFSTYMHLKYGLTQKVRGSRHLDYTVGEVEKFTPLLHKFLSQLEIKRSKN